MPDKISRFDGQYRFLSNFSDHRVVYDDIDYKHAENAFQAQKSMDGTEKERIAELAPGEAKRRGRHVQLRHDWEDVKISVMTGIVSAKFRQDGQLARMLLDTSGAVLIEGNTWNDTFWGACNGKGLNHLGRILMTLRHDLLQERAGRSETFHVQLMNMWGAPNPDIDDRYVTLYGTEADTAKAKAMLADTLKQFKHDLNVNCRPTWDEASVLRAALEHIRSETGIAYQIDAHIISDVIRV